jgi:hypothetical protein
MNITMKTKPKLLFFMPNSSFFFHISELLEYGYVSTDYPTHPVPAPQEFAKWIISTQSNPITFEVLQTMQNRIVTRSGLNSKYELNLIQAIKYELNESVVYDDNIIEITPIYV